MITLLASLVAIIAHVVVFFVRGTNRAKKRRTPKKPITKFPPRSGESKLTTK